MGTPWPVTRSRLRSLTRLVRPLEGSHDLLSLVEVCLRGSGGLHQHASQLRRSILLADFASIQHMLVGRNLLPDVAFVELARRFCSRSRWNEATSRFAICLLIATKLSDSFMFDSAAAPVRTDTGPASTSTPAGSRAIFSALFTRLATSRSSRTLSAAAIRPAKGRNLPSISVCALVICWANCLTPRILRLLFGHASESHFPFVTRQDERSDLPIRASLGHCIGFWAALSAAGLSSPPRSYLAIPIGPRRFVGLIFLRECAALNIESAARMPSRNNLRFIVRTFRASVWTQSLTARCRLAAIIVQSSRPREVRADMNHDSLCDMPIGRSLLCCRSLVVAKFAS